MMIQRTARVVAALFTLLGASCHDAPTAPRTGTLRVSVETTGGDLDVDGYQIVLGSQTKRLLLANSTLDLRDIDAGTYSVSLESVAENCVVSNTPPSSVTIVAGQTVNVAFEVACVAIGFAITTRSNGTDVPDAYQAVLNDKPLGPIASNGSMVVSRLKAGSNTLRLVFPSDNCTVAGGNPVTINVPMNGILPVPLEFTCVAATRLEKIAFNVAVGGTPSIGLVNPDGSGIVTLGPGNAPEWSPDGTRIVYSDAKCFPYYYYYQLCAGGLSLIDPETRNVRILANGNGGLDPRWSKTADVIVFWRDPGVLFTLAIDGQPAVQLMIPGVTAAFQPSWSPDGQRIAFACRIPPRILDLCTVDKNGANLQRLTSTGGSHSKPAWSRDGKKIAFVTDSEIDLITLDDGTVTRLTDGYGPSWSRDGTRLVFVGSNGLFTISADGSNRTRLTTGSHDVPAWRP
jgi:Tol biopolymer transport system component